MSELEPLRPRYRTVHMPRGVPLDVPTRWCLAESVWRFAAANGLVVQSFRQVDPRRVDDVPASVADVLGARRDEFDWYLFKVVFARA